MCPEKALYVELNFKWELRIVSVALQVLCNLKKTKKDPHLLRMEIQFMPWDKSALPQCGWVCMQEYNLVWMLFIRHVQPCPLNVNIIIMSNIKVKGEWNSVMHCTFPVTWTRISFAPPTQSCSKLLWLVITGEEKWQIFHIIDTILCTTLMRNFTEDIADLIAS